MKRGKPFVTGNKHGQGRPPGSRNRLTNAARKLLDEHDVPLTQKCIAEALRGDMKAMAMCMDRLLPLRRQPTPKLRLRRLETVDDIAQAYGEIMHAIAEGVFPSAEGQVLAGLMKDKLDMIALTGLEARLTELERPQKKAA
jgi:hypothetical protein